MSLPPHHPFSLEYTADPRPTFARAHADGRFIPIAQPFCIRHGKDDGLPRIERVLHHATTECRCTRIGLDGCWGSRQ